MVDSAVSLLDLRESEGPGQGVLLSGSPVAGVLSQGRFRFSQVPREPQCAFAMLSDPGRTSAPSHCGASVLPPLTKRRRLRRLISFEAQLHGFSTRCLRFMPPSLTTMQNSLPGVASLSGWDFSLPTEFHWRVSLSLPLSQGLPWRDLSLIFLSKILSPSPFLEGLTYARNGGSALCS